MDAEDFSYQVSKDERVFIAWRGRRVATLRGLSAARFRQQIAGHDRAGAQLLMARVTGNFKRGNERLAKQHRPAEQR